MDDAEHERITNMIAAQLKESLSPLVGQPQSLQPKDAIRAAACDVARTLATQATNPAITVITDDHNNSPTTISQGFLNVTVTVPQEIAEAYGLIEGTEKP